MWSDQFSVTPCHMPSFGGGQRMSKSAPCSPVKPAAPPVQKVATRADSFHVLHKVPTGDTPYVRAKHVQLVDKDPDRAIALFWAAINAGDRVDSALKDMAIVMKQQNRPEEAIEAIKSLRMRCSDQAQESLDNVLLDLYKRCGRLDDQIALLKHKLHLINQGMAFNGKRTKTARSLGKKFQVSIEQEATRLLGNLGWAYMQQSNFVAAEAVYRKALTIEPDNNKVCNLGICLMKQGRLDEAKAMLQSVNPSCNDNRWSSDSHLKSYERAQEMLLELETSMGDSKVTGTLSGELSSFAVSGTDLHGYELQYSSLWEPQPALPRQPRQVARSNLDKQFSQVSDSSLSNEWGTSKDYDENRPTSQPPLSKKSLDIPYHGAIQPQQNFAALPPLHNAAGKRSRTLTPVKDKTVSPWGSLGFTDSPRSTDFGLNDSTVAANDKVETEVKGYNADKEVIAEDSASAMELQRRRRLRVFQEMTLSSSLEA
ncbi:unnamed protein product [Sphagnum troendelagicum]|uniref:Uncharacterized protein n=1 Tax=Sphagnum troendelagicum TaxID=128251 RepID=A0ABP0U0Q4_9BRYO